MSTRLPMALIAPMKPLTGAELRQKFLDCASVGLSKKQAVSLFDLLSSLERLSSLRELPVVSIH